MIIKLLFLIIDHGFIIFSLIMPLLAVLYRVRANRYINENPSLKSGYNRIALWYGIVGAIPFIFIGYDLDASGMGMLYNLMTPDFVNFSVAGTWISSIILDVLFIYWIFFKKGAEILYQHPGLLRIFKSKKIYKIVALLIPAFQIIAYLAFHQFY